MQTASHFDRSLLPPPKSFYAREFGSALSQREDRKGYVSVPCIFHNSQNSRSRALSVNLREGNFLCFSCGVKGGGVIDFVMQRDRIDFKRAAQTLGAWREKMTPAETLEIETRKRERERIGAEEGLLRERERRDRIALRTVLHVVERHYRAAVNDHDWERMSVLFPFVRKLDFAYREAAGLDLW